MAKTTYSAEQIRALRSNPNVKNCSEKSITYAPAFKQKAILQYCQQGLSPQEIFLQAGFDLNMLGKEKPKDCLKMWKRIYRSQGPSGLEIDPRGTNRLGRKKPKYDENDPGYLKTKIAYLEAENDFLRKLKTKPKV